MTPAEIGANINNLKHRIKCISCSNAETQEQINDLLIRVEVLETNGGNIDVSDLLQRIEDLESEVSSLEGRVDTIENTLPLKADLIGGIVPDTQLPSYLLPLYVINYSALPAANTVTGKTYGVLNSQGIAWLPGSWGGTYYSKGYYYSDGTQWIFMGSFPNQATQSDVNAGIITDQFVSPFTFENASKWNTKWSINGNNINTDDWIGTLNNKDLIFKRNNIQIARFYSDSIILGEGATYQPNSIFLGTFSGASATSSPNSVFLGSLSGSSVINSPNSNFIGLGAGENAINSNNTNCFGTGAGLDILNASYSNLFGFQSGRSFTGNNIGSNNIIIGTNISLPNLATNSINLGGVIFATGANSNIFGNPSVTPSINSQVGIGIVVPNASAILDLTSTTRGALLPRWTTTQRNAIASPATGLIGYNIDTNRFNHRTTTNWVSIATEEELLQTWNNNGNTITAGQFIGTINNQDLVFRANNTEIARVTTGGSLLINTVTGGPRLHVSNAGNPSFWLSNSNISHPFTGVGFSPEINNNVIGSWVGGAATQGGMQLNGFNISSATNNPVVLRGYHGSTTPNSASVAIIGQKSNGSTGAADLVGNERILDIRTSGTVLYTFTASGLGIGTSTPATSAALDITSTNRAILLSRMTTAQRNALTAVAGMIIFNISTNTFQGFNGTNWIDL